MESGDAAWVLASAALVLFMTPGLAFFYGGMDRSRNVLNMLMMNFWCLLIVPVVWVVVAYSIAGGNADASWFGGFDAAFLDGIGITGEDGGMGLLTIAFLGMFAVITPALISGAVADRMKFSAWALFAPVWVILVFVPVFKWVYGGWLGQRGSLDFAGGTAIHVNAGIAALACVLVLGRRKGWPSEGHPPHSMPLVMLGTGILWFGWFGFNAGSALARTVRRCRPSSTRSAAAAAGWPGRSSSGSGTVTSRTWVRPRHRRRPGGDHPRRRLRCRDVAVWIGLAAGVVCCYAVGLKTGWADDALDVVGAPSVVSRVAGGGPLLRPRSSGPTTRRAAAGRRPEPAVRQALANSATIVYSLWSPPPSCWPSRPRSACGCPGGRGGRPRLAEHGDLPRRGDATVPALSTTNSASVAGRGLIVDTTRARSRG